MPENISRVASSKLRPTYGGCVAGVTKGVPLWGTSSIISPSVKSCPCALITLRRHDCIGDVRDAVTDYCGGDAMLVLVLLDPALAAYLVVRVPSLRWSGRT